MNIYINYTAKKYHANFKYVRDSDGWDYPKFQNNNFEETYDEIITVPDQYKTLPQFFTNNHLKLSYIEYEGKHYQPADLTKLKYSFTKDTDFIYHLVPDASVITYKDVTGLDKKDYDSQGVVITYSVMKNLHVNPNPQNGKWDYDTNGWEANWTYVASSASPDNINLTVYLKANDKSINRTIKYVDKDGNKLLPSKSESISVTHKVGEFEKDLKPKYEGNLGENSIFNIPSTKEINGQTYYFDGNNSNFATSAEKNNQKIANNGITVNKLAKTISVNVPETIEDDTSYIFVLPYVQSHINVIYKDVTGVDDDKYKEQAKVIKDHENPIVYPDQPGMPFLNTNGWNYEKDNWVVASTTEKPRIFVGQGVGQDGKYNQDYVIYLKHGTEQVTEHAKAQEIIHYYHAGTKEKIHDDYISPEINYSRQGIKDNVTKNISWTSWSPDNGQLLFKDWNSPKIAGYTADQASVPAPKVDIDKLVNNGKETIEKTVEYSANYQTANLNFVDDTTGTTLSDWDTSTGKSDSDSISFANGKEDLQKYLDQGYEFISVTNDTTKVEYAGDYDEAANKFGNFDHNDDVDQNFTVHLVHTFSPVTPKDRHGVNPSLVQKDVKETIKYIGAGDKTPKDVVQTSQWTRQLTYDNVTKKVVPNGKLDTDWAIASGQKTNYDEVKSPVIEGYHPDKETVPTTKVSQDDINITVTYSPNGQEVKDKKDVPASQITKFVDENGNELANAVVQNSNFHYSGDTYNKVTGKQTAKGSWDAESHKFDSVNAPVIEGYIAEAKTAEGLTATIENPNVENKIFYHKIGKIIPVDPEHNPIPDASTPEYENDPKDPTKVIPNESTPNVSGWHTDTPSVTPQDPTKDTQVVYNQTVEGTVTYIDDTTNQKLDSVDLVKGYVGNKINYSTQDRIDNYTSKGYKLVSDSFTTSDQVFNKDRNNFEVHFVHSYSPVNPQNPNPKVNKDEYSKVYTLTVHYEGAGDKTPKDVVQTSTWTRTLTIDNVTGKIIPGGKFDTNWAPDKKDYDAVPTPKIEGYEPNKSTIPAKPTVQKDITETVVYKADNQEIEINYIDKDTGKTLKTDTLAGKTNADAHYNTKDHISSYLAKHYIEVDDETNGNDLKFDNDSNKKQVYNVYLKHDHKIIEDSHEVNEIVHYIFEDGRQAAQDYNAKPINFTRTGNTDLVTNETAWNTWTSENNNFAPVQSPHLTDYTPDILRIDGISVKSDAQNFEYTVIYHPNAQHAGIKYIDDTTGNVMKNDQADGKFDQNIKFANDVNEQITDFEKQNYELVSNNFENNRFDADDAKNQFEVHFIHATKQVTRTDDVQKAIHYVYENGKQAQPDNAQTVHFTESGVEDLVTGKTKWTNATSQTFVDISTPKIDGYTPDQTNVAGQTVNFGDKDIHVTVTYKADPQTAHVIFRDDDLETDLEKQDMHGVTDGDIDFSKAQNSFNEYLLSRGFEFVNLADETASRNNASDIQDQFVTDDKDKAMSFTSKFGNPKYEQFFVVHLRHTKQSAMVQYVDDTENKVISTSGMLNGKSGEQIDYSTANTIDHLIGKGYELVSDATNGHPIILDQDSSSDQVYLVHLKHGIRPTKPGDKNKDGSNVVLTGKATAVIHYVDENGIKVADDKVQMIHFKRTGKTDAVTGEVIELDPWIADKSFISIKSPDVPGYTADKKEVLPATPMEPEEKAQEYTVVYTENEPGSNGSQDGDNGGGNDTDDNGGSSTDNPPSEDEPSTEIPTWVKNNEEKDTYVEKHKDSKPVYEDNKAVAKQIKKVANDAKRSARDGDVISKIETVNKRIVSADVHTTDKEQAELPQTGEKQSKLGLIGLAFASIAGLFGLAGNRKQRK